MSLSPDFLLEQIHTQEHTYLYCGKTNQIFLINPVMADIISLYGQCTLKDIQRRLGEACAPQEIAKSYEIVDCLIQERGFFQASGLQRRSAPVPRERILDKMAQGIGQMCLEVTQSCNLRCHYCAYSGGYDDTRQHGTHTMSQDVALAAIDFLFEKNREYQEPFGLSFYGGEPLLAFPLIKFCIEYARSLPWRDPEALAFNMTTNGTLLDEDKIRFLVDNHVRLLVSLDGPVEDHDAHRVYAHGGGSFARVMDNLHRFNEIVPQYRSLSINCVVTPTTDLLRTNDFFVQHHHLFRRLTMSNVSLGHKTFFEMYPGDPVRRGQQYSIMLQQYIAAHQKPGPLPLERPDMVFIRSLFERNLVLFHQRHIAYQVPSEFDVISTCFPGNRKLFVDAHGRFHACERVANTCSIGDVWNGFDLVAIQRLLDEYVALMNREECLNCWAFRLCTACFASMAQDGHLSLERTQKICTTLRRNLSRTLHTYCAILEKNPNAFDYMQEYAPE